MENDKLEIPFKKGSYIFAMVVSIAFVICGIYIIVFSFFELPEVLKNNFLYNPFIMRFIGILSIIFFGFAFVIIFRKLFDKNPGLVIDNKGIIDNTTGFLTRRIKWENIIKINEYNLLFGLLGQFIIITVDNHDEYIKQYKNKLFQILAKLDYKMTGSPINISSNVLKYKQKELLSALQNELKKWKYNK